jgi:hypothetical protein
MPQMQTREWMYGGRVRPLGFGAYCAEGQQRAACRHVLPELAHGQHNDQPPTQPHQKIEIHASSTASIAFGRSGSIDYWIEGGAGNLRITLS